MNTIFLGGWGRLGAFLPLCATVFLLVVRAGITALSIAAVPHHTAPLSQLRRKPPEK